MPRRQRSTARSMYVPSLSVDHALVNDVVALFGRRSSGNGLKHISAWASPHLRRPQSLPRCVAPAENSSARETPLGRHYARCLGLMAGHSKGEHRVALREKTRRKIRRTLADDAKRNPIFVALFGNAKQRQCGRLKSLLFVARRIAVRFNRNRDRGLAPQGEIESEATKDRNHDVQNFRRDSCIADTGPLPEFC
jgi:hypothetical protein